MNPFKRFWILSVSMIAILFLAVSCTKEFPRRMAVLTLPVDPVTAMAKGQIIDMGEDGISEHGFVYDSNATISANAQRVQLGKREATGSYEASLINLHPNTKYFVNSFLTSGSETTYGDLVSFTTVTSWPCGSPFTINHVAGSVAPVTKTVTYGTVTNIPGETSKCWITSNLGADHQATAVDDATEASAVWPTMPTSGHRRSMMQETRGTEASTTVTSMCTVMPTTSSLTALRFAAFGISVHPAEKLTSFRKTS